MTESESALLRRTGEPTPTAQQIRTWIINGLSLKLGINPQEIPLDEPLINLGIDSLEFVGMVAELEKRLGCRFKDNPLIDYPTLNALSDYLADQLSRGRTEIDPTIKDDVPAAATSGISGDAV
ncbi:MAG: acyl carrier protein [Planctomycetaceae bacterium]|nr:acyl carrier protein [Planctomycetaceae bacterium]